MNKARLSTLILCGLLLGCAEETPIDTSTITNETVKQAAEELEQEAKSIPASDSIPEGVLDSVNDAQDQRLKTIGEGLKRSPYTRLSDTGLDSLRGAWLKGYAASCDPAEFQRIRDALGKDEVLKQWAGQNVDSARAYYGRMIAIKKRCASAGN